MQSATETDVYNRQQGKLVEQSWEIAALTLLVRDIEVLNDELVERNEWLSKVATLLLSQPAWGWMPKVFHNRRIRRRIARHNLFDGDAYLKRYPDVAAEGMDPLHHYILHGMAEGRER